MRTTIRTLIVGLAILMLSGCAGSRCLHRPCEPECASSFDSPSPFTRTSKSLRSSWLSQWSLARLWNRTETPRDVTVRPEETPIPGAIASRSVAVSGVLDLPPAPDEREDD
ncbi:hypothetical protein [Planctomyces sp. SH-PL62]|uniref:hypothetical protein n=1 Tax=Planctomyces sp. SH-PL62 TaxID=1636152 RepID=UPI00078D15F9|nr:hypothetical protein [Planctomyces sp. SH-PL62]AMV37952.1 hypothetical protein VT85_10985 [Planctomyces sp. SH-PL62]